MPPRKMMPDDDTPSSLLAYAGLGGAIVCCFGLEILGGTAVLGGFAAAVGLSTRLTYLALTGIGGLVAVLVLLGYRRVQRGTYV